MKLVLVMTALFVAIGMVRDRIGIWEKCTMAGLVALIILLFYAGF